MRAFCRWLLSLSLVLILAPDAAVADQRIHAQVQQSLVELTAEGTARIGPSLGTRIDSSGTGFFVGTDAYILTTAHLFNPLKEANAANTKITARISGGSTVEALYVSELPSLDLVLLRAILPVGAAGPPSLEIGNSEDIDLSDPKLLTSGYDLTGYRQKTLEFNSTSNRLAVFAWTMNGKTNSGASGSPVYIDRNGAPLVVGVIKATAQADDEFTLMIPIEYSFQLIGQFKMQELMFEVARLNKVIGEISDTKPPLNARVGDIEEMVDEIERSFAWSADTDDHSGALEISYEKIVSGGPHIDEISVKIQPSAYVADEEDPSVRRVQPGLTWRAITQKRAALEFGGRVGTFVFPGIRAQLTETILRSDDTFRDQEPFRDIVLKISALSGETRFTKNLTIVPKYTWIYDTN